MHADHQAATLRGVVLGFNLSPKGLPEGFLFRVSDGGVTVQINFDPEFAGPVTAVAVVGGALTAGVIETDVHEDAAHRVFHLTGLFDAGDKPLFVARGLPEPDVTVRGKIVGLNYALRGEVNGGILDSGEFVHLRPHGVKAIGGLRVGEMLQARGEVRSGWSGTRVIEAREANGIEIVRPHKEHGPRHKPPGLKPGPAGHPPAKKRGPQDKSVAL